MGALGGDDTLLSGAAHPRTGSEDPEIALKKESRQNECDQAMVATERPVAACRHARYCNRTDQ